MNPLALEDSHHDYEEVSVKYDTLRTHAAVLAGSAGGFRVTPCPAYVPTAKRETEYDVVSGEEQEGQGQWPEYAVVKGNRERTESTEYVIASFEQK